MNGAHRAPTVDKKRIIAYCKPLLIRDHFADESTHQLNRIYQYPLENGLLMDGIQSVFDWMVAKERINGKQT
jgi:hypothetical protein